MASTARSSSSLRRASTTWTATAPATCGRPRRRPGRRAGSARPAGRRRRSACSTGSTCWPTGRRATGCPGRPGSPRSCSCRRSWARSPASARSPSRSPLRSPRWWSGSGLSCPSSARCRCPTWRRARRRSWRRRSAGSAAATCAARRGTTASTGRSACSILRSWPGRRCSTCPARRASRARLGRPAFPRKRPPEPSSTGRTVARITARPGRLLARCPAPSTPSSRRSSPTTADRCSWWPARAPARPGCSPTRSRTGSATGCRPSGAWPSRSPAAPATSSPSASPPCLARRRRLASPSPPSTASAC